MNKILLLIIFSVSAFAQNTISAIVKDKNSKELLVNVIIKTIPESQVIVTNKYGQFTISTPKSTLALVLSCVGYQSYKLDSSEFKLKEIYLETLVTQLKEIEVKSQKNEMGMININSESIRAIPMLMGEPDLLKALTTFPGVLNGREGSSGLFVRGGTPDQNQIVLDEAIIYNTNHLFGLVSTFNPDAINNIKLYKSYFPAEYGGRLSSVVDLSMREGTQEKFKLKYSVGLINSRVIAEGPINSKSSFLIAARSSYLGILALPFYLQYKNDKRNNISNYWMYDINAKYNIKLKNNQQLFLSFFSGKDIFLSKSKNEDVEVKNTFGWTNQTATLRYITRLGPKVFSKSILTYSNYNSGFSLKESELKLTTSDFKANSKLHDITIKQSLDIYCNDKLSINIGFELVKYLFQPSAINTSYSFNMDLLNTINRKFNAQEVVQFTEAKILSKPFVFNIGLRNVIFRNGMNQYFSSQPRLKIAYPINDNSELYLGYLSGSQNIHLLSNNSGISNDVWIPSSQKIKPEQVKQFSVGFQKEINSYSLTIEGFYKKYSNLIEYNSRSGFLTNYTNPYENNVETGGIGKSTGLEFMLKKNEGKLSGWFSLTLMKNKRKFDNLNNGDWYNANFDKPVYISSNIAYKPSNKYEINLLLSVSSGVPINFPESIYRSYNQALGITAKYYSPGKNKYRLPTYHRVDLSYTKHFIAKGKSDKSITFGIYNALFTKNIFYTDYKVKNIYEQNGSIIKTTGFEGSLIGYSIFPFLPYFNFSKTLR
ncbi:TonB-dependent receptor [Lacihabitans lacunae]|uniref:TonB-dependent receptor domain-containing protein n=1 Tax=Lacihabitans lacunae TaxID=1028214 RepID=A0ABV7Z0C6_9BACT